MILKESIRAAERSNVYHEAKEWDELSSKSTLVLY